MERQSDKYNPGISKPITRSIVGVGMAPLYGANQVRMGVKGAANYIGAREPSNLSKTDKEFAKANPNNKSLSETQREYLNNREGIFKGGITRRVKRTHKRKLGRKSKGRKTLHKRKTKRSRKSRK